MESLGQRKSGITFDMAIYVKARELQWWRPDEFGDVVVQMGGFHIILNYVSLLGKKFKNSGLEDLLLIQDGVCESTTISSVIKGKV